MRTVWIYKGLPASGKTTHAKEQVLKSNCGIVRTNKDDLRAMLHSSKHSKGNEVYVLQLRNHIILTALSMGKSVIVDDTNFYPEHEENIRQLVFDYNEGFYGEKPKQPIQVKVKYFEATPEECIERDLKRENSVGSDVIWDMYKKYVKKEKSEKDAFVLKQDDKLPHAIIVDIDGTVAFMRNHRGPYEYDKVDRDEPNPNIIQLVHRYIGTHNIIFLSGREDVCKEKTATWIKDNFGKFGIPMTIDDVTNHLYMRKANDNRKDTVVKLEIFDRVIRDKYYIELVLDDRLSVCRMWYQLGLPILRVGDPDADF